MGGRGSNRSVGLALSVRISNFDSPSRLDLNPLRLRKKKNFQTLLTPQLTDVCEKRCRDNRACPFHYPFYNQNFHPPPSPHDIAFSFHSPSIYACPFIFVFILLFVMTLEFKPGGG